MQCVAVKSALPEALFETIKDLTQESVVIVTGKIRAEPARHRRLRDGRGRSGSGAARAGVRSLSDHAEGARHRIPDGPSAPVAAQPAAARHHPRAARSDPGGARVFRYARLHSGGYAHLHAGGLRRHHHAVRSELLRRQQGVPDAIRPALQRSHGHGVRQGLYVRADVPRGEIQDAAASDRVLDGRAGDGLRRAGRREAACRRHAGIRGRAGAGEPAPGAEGAGAGCF